MATITSKRPPFVILPVAWSGTVSPYQLAVLYALACFANQDGHCFPGIPTLCRRARMSERKVQSVLRELNALGLVTTSPRFDEHGRQTSNGYQLDLTGRLGKPGEGADDAGASAPDAGSGRTAFTPEGVPGAPLEPDPEKPDPGKGSRHSSNELSGPEAGGSPPAPPASVAGSTTENTGIATGRSRTGSRSRKRPRAAEIPETLQFAAETLLQFWETKRGSHTEEAWECLLREVRKILVDPDGGQTVVLEQLTLAIAHQWKGLTYANWVRYGRPPQALATRTEVTASLSRGNPYAEIARQEAATEWVDLSTYHWSEPVEVQP